MSENKVILIRKQPKPFKVNYPFGENGNTKTYIWQGTKGKVLNERPVPFDVYEWIQNYTSTFTNGDLIIKETDDEDVNYVKENIEKIEDVEKCILTKQEIIDVLTKGNQYVMKKALVEIEEKTPDDLLEKQKKYIGQIASEEKIDSSTKREILGKWLGIDDENVDLLFDKKLDDRYKEASK